MSYIPAVADPSSGSVSNLQISKGGVSRASLKINALGDSISAGNGSCVYNPTGYGISIGAPIVPQWVALTVYPAQYTVQNGGLVYQTTSGGTSGNSGGPTGTSPGADGTVTWYIVKPTATKGANFLMFAEQYSNGALQWDMSTGYSAINNGNVKAIVAAGGTNYAGGDTVSFTNGAIGTLTIVGGVITACTLTQPGVGIATATINTSTGSGGSIICPAFSGGTICGGGLKTDGMVAMLPDAIASGVDVMTVMGGINDISNNKTYAFIIANLKTCYETLVAAGIKVVAIPILPTGSGVTSVQEAIRLRVNRWIIAYAKKETWANPNKVFVALCDPTGYFTDGTVSTANQGIGAGGGVAGAMFTDGLHPTGRGYQYIGYDLWLTIKNAFLSGTPDYPARPYTQFDGYSLSFNPGGNMLEGLPWAANTTYEVGDKVVNDTAPKKTYYCTTRGASAASGGPTGTGTGIADNVARWNYAQSAGMSTFNNGTGGTQTAGTGITYTGNLAAGILFLRNNGTSTAAIAQSIETPWSNGQNGQRQVNAFSLGSGGSNEQFVWLLSNGAVTNAFYGLVAADLGSTYISFEGELEVTGITNLSALYFELVGDYFSAAHGCNANGVGRRMVNSNGEMMQLPNGGKLQFRTPPIVVPTSNTTILLKIWTSWDGSGAADTATAVIKMNYLGLRKSFVN